MGSAATLLKNRSPGLAKLYRKLETTLRGFGDVEVVTRKRYALFRTTRIFADLTVMQDALRVVIHLGRKASLPCFIKIGPSGRRSRTSYLLEPPRSSGRSSLFYGRRSTLR